MSIIYYQCNHDERTHNFKINLYHLANSLYSTSNKKRPVIHNSPHDSPHAKNGWGPLYKSLFGLNKISNNVITPNTRLVLHKNIDLLITEFIKKFQVPFPRGGRKRIKGEVPYVYQLQHNYKISPLRIVVKLLLFRSIYLNENFLSLSTIENYIFANKCLVFHYSNYNILKLEKDIKNKSYSGSFDENVIFRGGQKNRSISPLLSIMGNASYLSYNNKILTLNITTKKQLQEVINIISYKGFWNDLCNSKHNLSKDKDSFMSYMQYTYGVHSDSYLDEPYNLSGKLKDYGCNIILFGAPGVGKSYRVQKIIRKYGIDSYSNGDKCPNVLRTTLYPDYDYTDFVGQIMPSEDKNNNITYKEKAGIFTQALILAYENPLKPVFLVLEEMSRCNITSVFGDVFQLLDRNADGNSIYAINNELISKKLYNGEMYHKIKIPGNLFIIGTLNTSDQSIYPMDSAFKRRFSWKYVSLNEAPVQHIKFRTKKTKTGFISWNTLRISINSYISKNKDLSEDKEIGQFFINFNLNKEFINHNKSNKKVKEARLEDYSSILNKLIFYLYYDIDKVASNFNENVRILKCNTFSDIYDKYKQFYNNKKKKSYLDVLSAFSNNFIKNFINPDK